jgi:hypothetical protein
MLLDVTAAVSVNSKFDKPALHVNVGVADEVTVIVVTPAD